MGDGKRKGCSFKRDKFTCTSIGIQKIVNGKFVNENKAL